MRTTWSRIRALFRGHRLDGELNDEIGCHLAMLEEEFRARGMTPAEAKSAARREFGGVAQTQEKYRERRGIPWLETSLRDIRYALRGLRRNPGFTAAAVLSLALGIGATTAVFSVFHAVMLRMLPVAKPGELALLRQGEGGAAYCSPALYLELQKRTDLFSGVLALRMSGPVRFNMDPAGRAETARMEPVSVNYFDVLGVSPAAGRLFTAEDSQALPAYRPAVLSYDLWRSRFGGDPRVVGRILPSDGRPLKIVGVAAPRFHGVAVEQRADLWVPLKIGGSTDETRFLWLMARRRPHLSLGRIQSALDVLMSRRQRALYGSGPNSEWRRKALEERLYARDGGAGLSFYLRDEFGLPLTALMAAAGLVLLGTCANIAHLLLARGAARRKEVAVRYSLGASRGRLLRQTMTESLLIGGAGGLLGAIAAFWGTRALILFVPAWKAGTLNVSPDGAALAFATAVSLCAALLFGLAPALRSTSLSPFAALRGGAAEGGGRCAFRNALVAAQVAFSVILVAVAGLFGHSLARLLAVDLGFPHRDAVSFFVDYPRAWGAAQLQAARDRFLADAAALPGVLSASFSAPDLLQGESWGVGVQISGSDGAVRELGSAFAMALGPRFFETLGNRPVLGRDFDNADAASGGKVAIVNQAFLRKFLSGDAHPLGRTLSLSDGEQRYIVGVVRDLLHNDLRKPASPTVYVPFGQIDNPYGAMPSVIVRGQLPPAALMQEVRRTMAGIHPEFAPRGAGTVRERIDESIFQERTLAALSGVLGGLALALAGIGLYGVVSYGTARRSVEIGIRIALGARRGSILWLVLRDALGLILTGLAIGLPLSLLAARTVRSILFGTEPGDPLALISTACVLLAIGLMAAFVPARRAAGMNPLAALRHE